MKLDDIWQELQPVHSNELWSVKVCMRIIKEDWTCWDVGAQKGEPYTHLFGLMCKYVVSVEPGPKHVLDLSDNIEKWYKRHENFASIEKFSGALSNREYKERVFYHCCWTLLPSTDSRRDKDIQSGRDEFDASFFTMDGIVSNNGYPTPHLLKMDVDGMEPFVVEGAMETIKQHRPIILMELGKGGSNDVGADIQKMAQDLIDIGYGFVFPHGLVRDADKVYDFTPGGETHSINVFAVPEDAINMVLGASASAKNMFS